MDYLKFSIKLYYEKLFKGILFIYTNMLSMPSTMPNMLAPVAVISLEDTIAGLIEASVNVFPNPIESGVAFPLQDARSIDLEPYIDEQSIDRAEALFIKFRDAAREADPSSDIGKAFRLCEHDIGYQLQHIFGHQHDFLTRPETVQDLNQLNDFFRRVMQFRVSGLAGAYFVSEGNPRFKEDIPLPILKFLLENVSKYKMSAQLPPEHATVPEAEAMYQIVRDARGNFTLSYSNGGRLAKLVYQDDGPGFRYSNSYEVPAAELKEFFNGFSTTGGGFGLSAAKRLMELRKGSIDLVSAPSGRWGKNYNTGTKSYTTIPSPGFKGARFTLEFPNGH